MANTVGVTGFKFVVAATLALLLSTFSIFPGISAAEGSRSQPAPPEQQIQSDCQSQDAQPVAVIANASYVHSGAVLWQPPADIECRDLFYGPGGAENAPDPSTPFTYVKRSNSGTQKKIIVQDVHGVKWTVKFGPEARPETAATRIVWAVGYHADQDYFVPRARIVGQEYIDARDVRFERHDGRYKEVGNWSWEANPFLGTREFEGLKVLMALLKNWDLNEKNNDIIMAKKITGPNIYYVADLGATIGRTGTFLNRLWGNAPGTISFSPGKSKGDPYAFTSERFIDEAHGGRVYFHIRRSHSRHRVDGVSVESARWMGAWLGRLSDKQLADAFCAGGYDQAETSLLVSIMRARIIELQRL
ncbi:MAG TPA: hypothetical protein VFY40_19250 [Blastocatellia bacterium]|nr:hypothetical protein [Blastocatellia bacterium]